MSISPSQGLDQVGLSLRAAMEQDDWESISRLDQECRRAVEEAMIDPLDEASLRVCMEELLSLYSLLIARCQTEKERVAEEIVSLNQSRQVAKVYQLFG